MDVIIKREGDNADILDSARLDSGDVLPLNGEAWFDLQDMNADGRIDRRDIRALDEGGNSLVTDSTRIWYDRTNGILRVPFGTAKLEYWIKTKATLGSGSASQQSGQERQGTSVFPSLTNGSDIPVPDGHSLLPPGYGWVDVLHAHFEDLRTRQDKALVEQLLKSSVRAYNETPAMEDEADLVVDAFFTPAEGNGQPPAEVLFRVFNQVAIGEPGDEGFQPGAEVGVGPGGQHSSVVFEYEYWGGPDSAHPDRSSPPAGSEPVDSGQLTISSDAFPTGLPIMLEETHASSGVFSAKIIICQAETDDCAATQGDFIQIPVNKEGDSIVVTYEDDSPNVTREAILPLDIHAPDFSLLSPATGSAGREDEPVVSFQVTDVQSGLTDDNDDSDSIYVVAGIYDLRSQQAADAVVFERDELRLSDVADGYFASVSIGEGNNNKRELDSSQLSDASQYEIRWWAVSSDKAGNVGISDTDSETACAISADSLSKFKFTSSRKQDQASDIVTILERNLETPNACDPNIIRVDTANPFLERSVTGSWLDDEIMREGPEAIRTSIVAVFNEDLDCTTVSKDVFRVNTIVPNDVTCSGSNVYLTVDELVSDATPTVEVRENTISDRAGNLVEAGSVTSEDSIPAKLDVAITGNARDGSRAVTKRAITVSISSDERLTGNPIVTINKVGDNFYLRRSSQGEAIPTGSTDQWLYTSALPKSGLYNVRVSAVDQGGRIEANAGIDETDFNSSSIKDPSSILFEVDNRILPPTFTPVDNSETINPNTFIRIDFGSESDEYGLSEETDNDLPPPIKTRKSTDDPELVDLSLDTNKTVELVSAIFDGADVTNEVVTRNSIEFIYHPGNLDLGPHRLAIEARDNAGNWWTGALDLTVVQRSEFQLPIEAGINLVSLPHDPVNGSINHIFGSNPKITSIMTYDNEARLWLSAIRGEDGIFVGDLTSIDGSHGYWIVSKDATEFEISLEESVIYAFPDTIEVVEGWNLVPITDLGQRPFDTAINASKYLSNINVPAAYGFDPQTDSYIKIDASTNSKDELKIGSAYWVYANEAGLIVP